MPVGFVQPVGDLPEDIGVRSIRVVEPGRVDEEDTFAIWESTRVYLYLAATCIRFAIGQANV